MTNGDNAFEQQITEEIFSFASAIYRVTELFPSDETLKNRLREFSIEFLTRTTQYQQYHQQEEPKNDLAVLVGVLSVLTGLESCIVFSGKLGIMRGINAVVLQQECSGFREYFERELQRRQRNMLASKASGANSSQPKEGVQKQDAGLFVPELLNDISINDNIKNDKKKVVNNVIALPVLKPKRSIDSGSVLERKDKIIQYLKGKTEARMADIATLFGNQCSLKTLQRDLSHLIENGKVGRQGDKRWAVYYVLDKQPSYEVPPVFLAGLN